MRLDRRCMAVPIRAAGMSVEPILPTDENSWPVCQDLACALPGKRDQFLAKKYCILSNIFAGLASDKIGRVVKLMDPDNPNPNKLHRSGSDAAALHVLLHT